MPPHGAKEGIDWSHRMNGLPNMSDEVKRINADQLRDAGQGHVLPITEEEWDKRAKKDEADLLGLAKSILHLRQYWPLTADNAKAAADGKLEVRGWYSHRPDTKHGNKTLPFKPDLEIFECQNRRPPLLVELKITPVKWRPGQREMVEMGFWRLACTLPVFVDLMDKWERE